MAISVVKQLPPKDYANIYVSFDSKYGGLRSSFWVSAYTTLAKVKRDFSFEFVCASSFSYSDPASSHNMNLQTYVPSFTKESLNMMCPWSGLADIMSMT